MYTMEDLKTNRDAQITVGSILFFVLAFPIYFGYAAGTADGSLGGGVADYQVNGEITFVELDSGIEYVADGTPWTATFNTDAINNADELNIVGLRVSMSYGEDELARGPPCLSQTAADTISGTASHLNFTNSADGQNNGGDGAHEVTTEWYNSSMVGAVVEGLTMDEIKQQIDSMGAGLGDHSVDIEVSADVGNENPIPIGGCQRSDNGEEVSYTVELVVLEYTIAPFIDTSEI